MNSKCKQMKDLILAEEILVLPGVYDGISAKLIEQFGFKGASCTGAGISNSLLGKPDVGFMTLTQNVIVCSHIAKCTNLLILADADTGYGNTINTYYTVQEFENAGATGVMIEDQTWPKRCGHMEGKTIIEAEEMVEKIKAAVDARIDPDFVIEARTDAVAVSGIDEAIRRANLYYEAGADFVKADALLSIEDIKSFVDNTEAPVHVNMGFGIRKRPTTPLLSAKELQELGVAVVTYPRLITGAAMQGMKNALEVLLESINTGKVIERPDLVFSFKEMKELMNLSDILLLEKKFSCKL